MTATALIAIWATGGLVAAAALSIWTRNLLTTPPRGPFLTDWIAPLVTAIMFGILAWRFGPQFDLLPYSALAAIGIQLAVIDVIELRLPGPFVYVGLAFVGALLHDVDGAVLEPAESAACDSRDGSTCDLLPGPCAGFPRRAWGRRRKAGCAGGDRSRLGELVCPDHCDLFGVVSRDPGVVGPLGDAAKTARLAHADGAVHGARRIAHDCVLPH